MRVLSLFILFLTVFAVPQFASAQDFDFDPNPPLIKTPIDPSKEIPEEFIKEAADIQNTCEMTKVMNQYYDCECRGIKFLEERMQQGELATRFGVELEIKDECRDSTAAAGREYATCLGSYYELSNGQDPEKFCECYANSYARLTEQLKPEIMPGHLLPIRQRALTTCANPGFARQHYSTMSPPPQR